MNTIAFLAAMATTIREPETGLAIFGRQRLAVF
jgi:hypothetical protein